CAQFIEYFTTLRHQRLDAVRVQHMQADNAFAAALFQDISITGLKFRQDPAFIELQARLVAVRLDDGAIALVWNFRPDAILIALDEANTQLGDVRCNQRLAGKDRMMRKNKVFPNLDIPLPSARKGLLDDRPPPAPRDRRQ